MKKILKLLFISMLFSVTFFTTSYFIDFYHKDSLINNNKNMFMNNPYINNEIIAVQGKENENKNIKGIITINGLGIEEKILQGSDNNYYMSHDINDNYDRKGSIFLDYRNTLDSKKLIIYGHNSKDLETIFGRLENYLDLDFIKDNPYIKTIFNDIEEVWQIFSVMVVPNTTKTHTRIEFSTGKELEEHILWMKNNSVFNFDVDVSINNQLMTLQTCYYEPEDSFLLINLKKVEDSDEDNI